MDISEELESGHEILRILSYQGNVQEIAEEVGYMDVYYFSKSLKNYYGVSSSKFSSKDRYQKK